MIKDKSKIFSLCEELWQSGYVIQSVTDFLNEKKCRLEFVRFCLFSDADLDI